jgi:thioredoxin reductase (NADPH)
MVIGGGNSGLEEGLFLTQFTEKVLVVERSNQLRGSKLLQDKVMNHPKMEVLLGQGVAAFRPKDGGSGKLGTVELEDLKTGEKVERHPQGVFVFIGLDPNTEFLQRQITLDERGFLATDPTFMTDVPGVFAAGDVRGGSTKQLASAVGEGAAVAIQIRGFLDRMEREGMG